MIPLKDAQAKSFAESTRAELRLYAEELGIEGLPQNASAAQLRKAVCNSLGIAIENEGRAAPTPKIVKHDAGGDTLFPSYNLTPNGIWGGRRHRLSIPRPDGAKAAAAEGFAWNGKHTYYIPYDEVDSVPEPIYNIIVTNKRRRAVTVPQVGGEGEYTTKWEFDSNPIYYIGVDPETANRAGSLIEWYQARGSEWYKGLTQRQITQVARVLEVPMTQYMGEGVPRRQLTETELRDRVLENLYGFADAVVEPDEAILR